ncbi:hypothetical protein WJX73_010689 [Symbiochloris irregularis]|uniref:NAD(P)-binding domain-containing protein n=1 Tax=Symbiochloris irregularis TaxID=706552 RepID=A0AAW1NYQ1_9CHLO
MFNFYHEIHFVVLKKLANFPLPRALTSKYSAPQPTHYRVSLSNRKQPSQKTPPGSRSPNDPLLISSSLRLPSNYLPVSLFGGGKVTGIGGGEIFIAGGTSPLALQITQQLLGAGAKVAAGVTDLESGQELLDFAKSFELVNSKAAKNLRLVPLDVNDEEEIAGALPRRGTVVLLPGDAPNGLDSRAPARIVNAAQEAGAARVVLVQQKTGGGGFFGLFGGGANFRQLEQQLASSGLQFIIIRTGKQTQDIDPLEMGSIVLGPQGASPSGSAIAKAQVAEIVATVLSQASDDILIEAWADPKEQSQDLGELVSQVLPEAVVDADEEDEEPEPVKAVSSAGRQAAAALEEEAPKKTGGLFGFGGRQSAPEPEPEPAPKPSRGFLGFGPSKSEMAEEPQEQPKRGGLFGGGTKVISQPKRAAPPTPPSSSKNKSVSQKPSGGLFGGGKAKQEAEPQPKREEEAVSTGNGKASGGGGLFGKRKGAEPVSPSASKARKSAQQKASAKRASPAPKAGRSQAEPGPETKTGGFFSALGFGAQAEYDDEE